LVRIGKAEHARILRLVDVEQRKVADVAAEYGCSTANIYVLLGRLRRANAAGNRAAGFGGAEAVAAPTQDAPAAPVVPQPAQAAAADLLGVTGKAPSERSGHAPTAAATAQGAAAAPERPTAAPVCAENTTGAGAAEPAPSAVLDLARKQPVAKRGGIGAARARPGVGLMMRTAEGEENVTPFRSLEDLLSAVKPVLRAAAHSPDPVWFSIQTLDLASLDFDAA
jgi:hypothetical protein